LQTVELLRAGESLRAALYILTSVLLCVVGTALGHSLAAGLGTRS
jgi:fluoride ion exporter CrcB/FEX